jgi:hypothetical protein
VVLQATPLASHVYGAQAIALGAMHLPSPSHLDAPMTLLLELLQLAAAHTTSFHRSHFPAPSQLPVLPQLA